MLMALAPSKIVTPKSPRLTSWHHQGSSPRIGVILQICGVISMRAECCAVFKTGTGCSKFPTKLWKTFHIQERQKGVFRSKGRLSICLRAMGDADLNVFSSHSFEPQMKWLAEMGHIFLEKMREGASQLPTLGSHNTMLSSTESGVGHEVYGYQAILSGIFPDVTVLPSLYIYTTTLAFVIGAALYIAKQYSNKSSSISENETSPEDMIATEWILMMSPTPFNRFVMLKCPTISFQETDSGESFSEKLVTGDRHFVSLQNMDRKWSVTLLGLLQNIEGSRLTEGDTRSHGRKTKPVFQRQCLLAEDGGVVAIDWPSHLDLTSEHGLDTTFLLVPGTAEGSQNKEILNFVQRALTFGYFPIVLNPRGSAGSPVTTPRLFTAADSDDVHLAVKFIARSRPWTTIMAVGWGYGANMLVKYLGEQAEATPLTAAVSIENPFDLEEATRSGKHNQDWSFDQKMKNGLVQILKSNKMLFEGKNRGFDLNNGLSATSVREFDMAISRVAHGFETLKEFYENASSRSIIDEVKIPLLCVQGDESMGQIFSIPRHLFEKNPFTTLLVSHSKRSLELEEGNSFVTIATCCDALVIEWLAAVELALLKGRHPLVQGIDVTFRPAKESNDLGNKLTIPGRIRSLERHKTDPASGFRDEGLFKFDMQYESNQVIDSEPMERSHHFHVQSEKKDNESKLQPLKISDRIEDQRKLISNGDVGNLKDTALHSADTKESSETADGAANDGEEVQDGQVCKAAESVMKALDVTMPGTLSEDQKQQVLDAVERGETIVTALQEAVPEEVRGKMAAAISGAVQARGINLKLVGFGKNMPAPQLPAGMKEKIKEKLAAVAQGKSSDSSTSNNDDGSGKFPKIEPLTGESENTKKLERENWSDNPSDSSQNTEGRPNSDGIDEKQVQANTNDGKQAARMTSQEELIKGGDLVDLKLDKENNGKVNGEGAAAEKQEGEVPQGKSSENEISANQEKSTQSGEVVPASHRKENVTIESEKQVSNSDIQFENKEDDIQLEENSGNTKQLKKEVHSENKTEEKKHEEQEAAAGYEENQNKQSSGTKTEETSGPQTSSQPSILLPSISMQLALDALTGFDDSTQMAVTNVFGVIESMIEKLEKDQQQKEEQQTPETSNHQNSDQSVTKNESMPKSDEEDENDSCRNHSHLELAKEGENGTWKSQYPQCLDSSSEFEVNQLAESTVDYSMVRRGKESVEIPISSAIGQFAESENMKNVDNRGSRYFDELLDEESSEKSLSGLQMLRFRKKKSDTTSEKNLAEDVSLNQLRLQPESGVQIKEISEDGDVSLEYFPEEDTWKIFSSSGDVLENYPPLKSEDCSQLKRHASKQENAAAGRPGPNDPFRQENNVRHSFMNSSVEQDGLQVVEPSYVILDDEINSEEIERLLDNCDDDNDDADDVVSLKKDMLANVGDEEVDTLDESPRVIQKLIVDALKLEVQRRLGMAGMETLGIELEDEVAKVAAAVVEAARSSKQKVDKKTPTRKGTSKSNVSNGQNFPFQESGKIGVLHGGLVVHAVRSVLSRTQVLGRLIPAGVLIEVILAALGTVFFVVTDVEDDELLDLNYQGVNHEYRLPKELSKKQIEVPSFVEGAPHFSTGRNRDVTIEDMTPDNEPWMGVMVAAMGATAAVASHGSVVKNASITSQETQSKALLQQHSGEPEANLLKDYDEEKEVGTGAPNLISSFAEKAMTVAAPVVPTKQDGEVDHERLVAMLADLGQKGGILRFVGKAALLWGGLRGAMSLTDRLLIFFRISERPLHQRLGGFVAMVFLLWSPVLVPLLPTLLQQWASRSIAGSVAECVSVMGLYAAIVILVTIWGKRIRGYNQPLSQYGLNLFSKSKMVYMAGGLATGFMIVGTLYTISYLLGFVHFTWAASASLTGTKAAISILLVSWRLIKLVGQGFGTGLAIASVEELLFRSWLLEEIAVELGFHRAVVLSGLVFSIVHWSLPALPGLWLLSLALAGAKEKGNGDLALPIGIHGGLIAGNFILTSGKFVRYSTNAPRWFTGAHVGNPLAGALGLFMVGLLALVLYPRERVLRHNKMDQFDMQKSSNTS